MAASMRSSARVANYPAAWYRSLTSGTLITPGYGLPDDLSTLRTQVLTVVEEAIPNCDWNTRPFDNLATLRRSRVHFGERYRLGSFTDPISLALRVYPTWAAAILREVRTRIATATVNGKQTGPFGGWTTDGGVRKVFKAVNDACSEGAWLHLLSDFRLAVPLVGLHTAGGPSPHTKVSIIESARDWVSGEATLFATLAERTWARTRLRTIVGRWISGKEHPRDSFDHLSTIPTDGLPLVGHLV